MDLTSQTRTVIDNDTPPHADEERTARVESGGPFLFEQRWLCASGRLNSEVVIEAQSYPLALAGTEPRVHGACFHLR